jgi:hypothetical protein
MCKFYSIVTYEGFSWLIITGSGLDDCIYWHFFTIKINNSSSQLVAAYDFSIPYWTTSVPLWRMTDGEWLLTESLNSLTEPETELLYDWRITINQFVLAPSP